MEPAEPDVILTSKPPAGGLLFYPRGGTPVGVDSNGHTWSRFEGVGDYCDLCGWGRGAIQATRVCVPRRGKGKR